MKTYLGVFAGNDGPDSIDWAMMLLNMYEAWFQSTGDFVKRTGCGRGGYIEVSCDPEFILESEIGVHRLVRLSPHDSAHRRCTTFCGVTMTVGETPAKLRDKDGDAMWASLRRSYVLYPYKLVRDHQTGNESQEVERFLAGELDLLE